ncbi:unnamed protein product [Anisakis simplex]|uniref:Extensin-like n=1 Tax=Anisakis simplex TaxID=6269 RepID=A0A0M3JFE0_ANISI|nr:unnamed protein product [Anisakis simplex]
MRARQKEAPPVPNNANPPQVLARSPKAATSGPTYSPYERITPTPQQQQLLLLPTTQLPVQLQQQVSTPQPQTPNPPTPPSKPIRNQMVNDYKPIRLNPIALPQQPYNALLQQPLPQNQPQSYPSVQSLSTPYQQTLPVQSSSSIFNKPFQFNVPIGIPRLPRLPFRAPRMGDLFNRIIPNPRSVTGYFQDIRSYLPRLNIPLKIPSPSSSPSSSRSLLPKLQFARGDPQQNGPFLPRIVIPSSTA